MTIVWHGRAVHLLQTIRGSASRQLCQDLPRFSYQSKNPRMNVWNLYEFEHAEAKNCTPSQMRSITTGISSNLSGCFVVVDEVVAVVACLVDFRLPPLAGFGAALPTAGSTIVHRDTIGTLANSNGTSPRAMGPAGSVCVALLYPTRPNNQPNNNVTQLAFP